MRTAKATRLQTEIICQNLINTKVVEFLPSYIESIEKLKGINPLKVNGEFKEKYKQQHQYQKYEIIEVGFKWWVTVQIYISHSYKSIDFKIVVSVSGGGYDQCGVNCNHSQHSKTIEIAKTDNLGLILEISEINLNCYKVTYKETEILEAAKNVEIAANNYNKILDTVPYIFRDVLYLNRLTR